MSTNYDDIENMTDEEFMNLELPESMDFDTPDDEDAPASEEADEEVADVEEDTESDEETEVEETDGSDEDEESEDEAEADDANEEEDKSESEEEDEDPLAELYKPFKANNREMKVDSIEEARTLMKMGANYNKKMAAIKPLTRVGRMLEKHGLLDEGKLSYLIDLHNKNPQAIAKLVTDSGIDPLDVSDEDSTNYKPASHAPSDTEMALEDVIQEISDTDAYTRTVDVVSKQWDKKSAGMLTEEPTELIALNEQIGNGVFDLISAEVDKQRTFNNLRGLSDFEAYKKVGAEMLAKANAQAAQQGQATATSESTNSKPKSTLASKRKVALPKKKATSNSSLDLLDIDDISKMSDEEFDKFFAKKLR